MTEFILRWTAVAGIVCLMLAIFLMTVATHEPVEDTETAIEDTGAKTIAARWALLLFLLFLVCLVAWLLVALVHWWPL